MDRAYTFKEANRLIKIYNKLLKDLAGSNSNIDKYKKRIITGISVLIRNYFFQGKMIQDFKSEKASEWNYNDIDAVLRSSYGYFKSQDLCIKCEGLYNENSEELIKNIYQLKSGQNILKWFFSNNTKKKNAEESFTYLKNMLNSDFYAESAKMLGDFTAIDTVNKMDVYNDVDRDINKYRKLIIDLYPEINVFGHNNSFIDTYKKEYDSILSQKNRISDDIEIEKSDIKKQLEILISIEMMNVIREIPVEELNRAKRGIRVKTLRDAGYKNIADIYTSSINKIASVQGISYSAAMNIKDIAMGFAKGASNNVKIKLNADNRDKVSTQVVKLVNRYINKKICMRKAEELINKFNSVIEINLKKISDVSDGVKYYFSSTEDKKEYIESYIKVRDYLYGEQFGKNIKKVYSDYHSIKLLNENEAWQDFVVNTVEYYNAIEEIYPGLLGNDDIYYGLPEDLANKVNEEILLKDGLLCTLRHYQEMGVKYILHQQKVLLGDEMGLGKTIQAIATMVSLKNKGGTHFIVICPASVLTNWCREIEKHSKLEPIMVHGSNRRYALAEWKEKGGVAVTTYEGTLHIDLEDNFKYSLLVVDEAHYIKNPEARRSKYTEKIAQKAERILFMTGTALENRVDEMINLIRILNQPISRQIKNIAYLSSAPKFREMISPVYYRRKRDDVLTELPELIETKEWCRMEKEEQIAYENSLFGSSLPEIRRVSWNVDDLKYSSKATRLKELVEEAKEDGRKVIVFSFFLSTIQKISEFLGNNCTQPITGAVSPERRQEIIDEFDNAPAGTVLISQIIAGGTGLNIQSASVVIICEPQFKPSIENQAISRAYRMGQARNVLVYRLLCEDTIDERITELLEKKQRIFDEFADKSVAAESDMLVEVSEKAFGDIVKEEKERVKEKNNI